jgi:hypothetical protein
MRYTFGPSSTTHIEWLPPGANPHSPSSSARIGWKAAMVPDGQSVAADSTVRCDPSGGPQPQRPRIPIMTAGPSANVHRDDTDQA